MSVYPQLWEDRCWQCQDVERCEAPLAELEADVALRGLPAIGFGIGSGAIKGTQPGARLR